MGWDEYLLYKIYWYWVNVQRAEIHDIDQNYEYKHECIRIASYKSLDDVQLFQWQSHSIFTLSRLMTKTTKWHVRPAKTQFSLGIRPDWSESSLCAHWVAKDPSFLHADSKYSDQTGRIWVFAGRTATLLVLSWGGSHCIMWFAWYRINLELLL